MGIQPNRTVNQMENASAVAVRVPPLAAFWLCTWSWGSLNKPCRCTSAHYCLFPFHDRYTAYVTCYVSRVSCCAGACHRRLSTLESRVETCTWSRGCALSRCLYEHVIHINESCVDLLSSTRSWLSWLAVGSSLSVSAPLTTAARRASNQTSRITDQALRHAPRHAL